MARLRWGAFILILGFLSPLLIPVVLASSMSDGLKTILSGGLALGIPEVFMIIAIAIMGKDGYEYLKRFLRLLLRAYGPADKVSSLRYTIGLIFFCIPLIVGFIAPYFLINKGFYMDNIILITILLDVMLLASLIILGGDFWDKLRSLFVNGAVAQFPEPKSSPKEKGANH